MKCFFIYLHVMLSGLFLPFKSFSDELPSIEFLEFLALDDVEAELLNGHEEVIKSDAKEQAKDGDVAASPE